MPDAEQFSELRLSSTLPWTRLGARWGGVDGEVVTGAAPVIGTVFAFGLIRWIYKD